MNAQNNLCRLALLVAAFAFSSLAEGRAIDSFATIAADAIPGVVNIRSTSYHSSKNQVRDLYQFFLRDQPTPSKETHAVGSGVVVDKTGHILTNEHVIEGASKIEVLFAQSKKRLFAKVVGTDSRTDLALLKVEPSRGARPLSFGSSQKLRVGDRILAIGNPFGYAHTVTSGIISAKGRVIGAGPYDNFLQTDASIHPGNSGGPLIDMRGRLVGIATAVAKEGAGIGFAIPSTWPGTSWLI